MLVDRRHGDVTLTETGLELAQRGDTVLAATHDLVDFARLRSSPLTGGLALGIIPTLAPYRPAQGPARLQRQIPGPAGRIARDTDESSVDELMRGSLDVLMLALPVLEAETATVCAVRRSVPAGSAGRRPAARRDGRGAPTISTWRGSSCSRRDTACATRRSRSAPGIAATIRSGSARPASQRCCKWSPTATASRCCPKSQSTSKRATERVKLLRFAPPRPSRTIGLAWRRPRRANPTSSRSARSWSRPWRGQPAEAGASDDQFARGLKPTRRPPTGSHKIGWRRAQRSTLG